MLSIKADRGKLVASQPEPNRFAAVHNIQLLQNADNPLLLEGKEHLVISHNHHMIIRPI